MKRPQAKNTKARSALIEADAVATLSIVLDRVRPTVARIVEVPVALSLHDLHRIIQATMPWGNYHLYEFRAHAMRWRQPDEDWPIRPRDGDATVTALVDLLLAGVRRLIYVYDLGDFWQHNIRVMHIDSPAVGVTYPHLVSAERRCPPDDVGGPAGYHGYVAAVTNPAHAHHADMMAWRGAFDPESVDVASIESHLAALFRPARKRSPKSRHEI